MIDRTYVFDRFRLNPAARELHEDIHRLSLPSSAFDCLVYLIEHRDRAIGRDELISAVWGRTDVSDTQLSQAVARVRRTLGDTGSAQTTICTIRGFGYRWVADIRCEIADAEPRSELIHSGSTDPSPSSDAAPPHSPDDSPTNQRGNEQLRHGTSRALPRGVWLAMLAVFLLTIGLLVYLVERPSGNTASRSGPQTPLLAERPAAVLPTEVDAPSEWRWLRLGLTSLIANRLRDGQLPTLPSTVVIHLLQNQQVTSASATKDEATLRTIASMRIQPKVTLATNLWRVRLVAIASDSTQTVEVTSTNPLTAARSAADQLLVRLGRKPPPISAGADALNELLGRVRAASLAGQLDLADTLIREAPDGLRSNPLVQLTAATNVYRAGDYKGARRIALALLDAPSTRGEPTLRAQALNILGVLALREDDTETAAERYGKSVKLLHGEQDRAALGTAYMGLGIVAAKRFRYDTAIAQLGRARIELVAAGDLLGVAQVDENLGNMQALRHKPYIAVEILKAAQKRFSELGAQEQRAMTLANLAQVQMQLLEHRAALATTELFWPAKAHTSNERLYWRLIWVRSLALVDNGRLAEGRFLLDRIAADADPDLDASVRVLGTALAANVAMVAGNFTEAARLSDAARIPLLEISPFEASRIKLLHTLALRRAGKLPTAATGVDALNVMAETPVGPRETLYIELAIAQQTFALGDSEVAMVHFAEALQGAQSLSIPEDLVTVTHPYVEALLAEDQLNRAQAVAGGTARWADQDYLAAWTQACLLNHLGANVAARNAAVIATRLAGERVLPTPLCGERTTASDQLGAVPTP